VEERRAVIALDDGDRAAGLEVTTQPGEGVVRVREVFEDEAEEDMVELLVGEVVQVRVPPVDAGVRCDRGDPGFGLRE
jgi:hypothetical protein